MSADAREFFGYEPEPDTRSLFEVLLTGRETPIPVNAQTLISFIEKLGLPDLASDTALLVAAYTFKFGQNSIPKALRLNFGEDVEDRLNISFTKKGRLQRPGIDSILARIVTDDLLPDYQGLELEIAREKFILKMPIPPKLPKVK